MATGRKVHHYVSAVVLVVLGIVTTALLYVTSVENRVAESDAPVISDSQRITDFASCVAAGNPVMESYPEQCSADGQSYTKSYDSEAAINQALLPEGWFIDAERVTSNYSIANFNNDGLGVDESVPSCFLQTSVDELDDRAITAEEIMADVAMTIKDLKGYDTVDMGTNDYEITLNGLTQAMTFYDLIKSQPESPDSAFRSTETYIVGKQDYVSVSLSCTNGTFTDPGSVLRAVSVDVR